jgi:hypothetical protein
MKAKRRTVALASASVLLAFALGFAAGATLAKAPETAPTKPPAATSATSDEATTMLLGDWLGTLDTGEGAAKLRLVLHLGKNPDGTLNGSIDSLDENVKGIPVDKPTFADGTLGLNLPTIGVHCEATLAPNRVELKGTWYKRDATFPLEFKTGAAPAADQRPGS